MKRSAHASPVLMTLRWLLLLLFLAAALFFLTDAFFSAWVAGGPTAEHKIGWERRSLGSLALTAACLFGGIAVFRAIPRLPHPGAMAWLMAALAVALALAPWVGRQVLIDRCLDSGGRWNSATLECDR